MTISDHELWACALHIQRHYGDQAAKHIADRIKVLGAAGDQPGVITWQQIASRLDRIEHAPGDLPH